MHILLLDDEQELLKITSKLLSLDGHTVVCADTADSAINELKQAVFDLFISDIFMPGDMMSIDAIEFAQHNSPATKVLVVTGYQGITKVSLQHIPKLKKPFSFNALRTTIAELFS